MDDEFTVSCPYCGEQVRITLEPDVTGDVVQDCEVCCNPWLIKIEGAGDNRSITVIRGDGSE
jgi:cysteine-rich CPXCG protein